MAPVLLSAMPFDKGDIELHLRLLNKWKVGNPSKPDQFYAFSTLWADAEGTVIEANSHRVFTDILAEKLNIGEVYILTRFTLDMPRKAFRTCSFPRLLVISPSSLGGVVCSPPPTFPTTAFELVPFEDINVRQSPCPYLSDVTGRPKLIKTPNHVTTHFSDAITPLQEILLVNERGVSFPVTLWGDFTTILDPVAIMAKDAETPIVLAFGALRVSPFNGVLTGNSTTATRIVVDPNIPSTTVLIEKFASDEDKLQCVQSAYDTPEKRAKQMSESFRTIAELNDIYATSPDVETRYRCKAQVLDIDTSKHWAYRACKQCSRVVAPNQDQYWCPAHYGVDESDTQQ
ncbi:Replication protein A 70 kDa DNA-binding subunit B, partial [Linum perenne]